MLCTTLSKEDGRCSDSTKIPFIFFLVAIHRTILKGCMNGVARAVSATGKRPVNKNYACLVFYPRSSGLASPGASHGTLQSPDISSPLCQESPVESKRRVHFLDFMLDVHERMHRCRQQGISGEAMVSHVADEILEEGWLLCFDEMQVLRSVNSRYCDSGKQIFSASLAIFIIDIGWDQNVKALSIPYSRLASHFSPS